MLGLFGSLNMASRSLSTQQEAMAVAGNNLANVNNTAYAREQLNVKSSTAIQTQFGSEGTGIDGVSITEVRNSILDNQIQSEGSVTSSLSAQQSALQDAEATLDEQLNGTSSTGANTPTSATGLAQGLSNLFNSFQSLSSTPADPLARGAAVQSAQQLTQQFNQVSASLQSVRDNLNTSIQTDVASANQDLASIASLNKQIIVAQAGGNSPNELIDQRQQTLEDLATKLNVTTVSQPNGSMDISVAGANVVTGGAVTNTLYTTDTGGGHVVVNESGTNGALSITGGSIGGSITARDGGLAQVQSSINTLASQLITQVNGIYSSGIDSNGNTGQNFFTGTDASNIGVNTSLANDYSTFQASGTAGNAGDNTVVLKLAQLANTSISGLGNRTLSQNYSQTVATLGANIASINDQVNNGAAVTQMLNNQRSSTSGVSTDEEMTNLVQFQQSYEASAQLITTLNQMLETLIAMKTE